MRELENGMVSGAYTCGIDYYHLGADEYPDYDDEDEMEDEEDDDEDE